MSTALDLAPKLYTAEDLERLSAEGHRYELIHGELRPMSPAGGLHGSAAGRRSFALTSHVNEHSLGAWFAAETGFQLQRDPDTTKAPDWAFIQRERLSEPLPAGYVPIVPDVVLETRSPGDRRREIQIKIDEWLDAGLRVLDQDPETRTIYGQPESQQAERFGPEDTLRLEDVFPGFSAPVERLFPSFRHGG